MRTVVNHGLSVMNRKKLSIVIAAMILSLTGLIGVQLYWIDTALRLNDEQFEHRVNEALDDLTHSMEEQESARLLAMHFEKVNGTAAENETKSTAKQIHLKPNVAAVENEADENFMCAPPEATEEGAEITDTEFPQEDALETDEDDVPSTNTLRIREIKKDSIGPIRLLYHNKESRFDNEQSPEPMIFTFNEEAEAETSVNNHKKKKRAQPVLRKRKVRINTNSQTSAINNAVKEINLRDSSIRLVLSSRDKVLENVMVYMCNEGVKFEDNYDMAQKELEKANLEMERQNIIHRKRSNNLFTTVGYNDSKSSRSRNAQNADYMGYFSWTQNAYPHEAAKQSKRQHNIARREAKESQTSAYTLIEKNNTPISVLQVNRRIPSVAKTPVSLNVVNKLPKLPQFPAVKKGNSLAENSSVQNDAKNATLSVQSVARKVDQVTDVTARWIAELAMGRRSIKDRVQKDSLENLISMVVKNRGIDIPYSYEVVHAKTGNVEFAKSKPDASRESNACTATLFPNDIMPSEYELHLRFHDNTSSVLSKIWKQLLASGIFLSIVVTTFAFTVVTMNKQKKISDMKTEFINNMTHEFQTPISTISLASEALRDPDISADEERRHRFARIIHTENKRLGKHVELLLQAAQLENGNYSICSENVDMHAVILSETANAAMQVEHRGGNVQCRLRATNSEIVGDGTHLSNIIRNLLDNANKYSPDAPEIHIQTYNDDKNLTIAVSDKGRGLTREQSAMVFERFYRVPTGNRHDVKGFGLGLSYVKAMVEAHGGTISVESEPHKGSTFTITLPFHSPLQLS